MQRVVILGGGFGGLYAAKALHAAEVEITLIDRRNFHLFQPLLYQVATGSLSPGEIAAPLRDVLSHQKNVRVLLDEASDLDASAHKLLLKGGGEMPYDTLVVATGSRPSYFGHTEWEKVAPGLKTIEDATAIRRKILFAFEAAERETNPDLRRQWLTFAVVGAGPTGVELAGALAEIAHETLRHDFRSIRPEESQILLLDGTPRVLPSYPEDLSLAAEKSLIRLGVRARNNVRVTAVDAEGVTLRNAAGGTERLATRTVLWAAGVSPSEFGRVLEERAEAPLNGRGQVLVDADLTVPGHPEIFVIGDLAYREQNGKPLPGVAPVAMQQGGFVARAIQARIKGTNIAPFHYHDKGSLAVIGRAAGVADFGRFRFHGFLAWLLWLSVHLTYLVQFQNRLIVFIRWGLQYLTFSRGARLITGTTEE
jgi:NADH dehydrogenase